jgi:hypothetical protein
MRATLAITLASLFLGCERHPSPPVAPASVPAQLDKLSRRGSASVPDIIQQLHAGDDANLTWPETVERSADYRKFHTLRAALIALLGDIGGEEAMAYLRELIATTRDPLEVALAGRFLEEREPGRHREMLVTSARTLLAGIPADATPVLQLLALYGGRQAVADIEAFVQHSPAQAAAAMTALTLLRRDGGDLSLVNWWRRPDVATETRSQLAYALGVVAPDSTIARDTLRQIIATSNDSRLCEQALLGLATGESFLDERLLPREMTVMARPHSKWLTARLEVLDALETSKLSAPANDQVQKVRDELLEDLERTQ